MVTLIHTLHKAQMLQGSKVLRLTIDVVGRTRPNFRLSGSPSEHLDIDQSTT
jgi:hypothetical protein